jgi:hypothetical protein
MFCGPDRFSGKQPSVTGLRGSADRIAQMGRHSPGRKLGSVCHVRLWTAEFGLLVLKSGILA